MLKEHAGGIITHQPLGDSETLESASPEIAAIYMVRCARIAARLHWRPWPPLFTEALRMGLRGLREDVGELYMDTIYPRIAPMRGDDDGSFTLSELAARCVDGVGYVLSHYRTHHVNDHGDGRPLQRWAGAPTWTISRCWWACQHDDASLAQLRIESIRHLIHLWRGDLTVIHADCVAAVDAAGIAGRSLEAARVEALKCPN